MICTDDLAGDDSNQNTGPENLELWFGGALLHRGLGWVWSWLEEERFFSLLGWMNHHRLGSDSAFAKLCFFQFTHQKRISEYKELPWGLLEQAQLWAHICLSGSWTGSESVFCPRPYFEACFCEWCAALWLPLLCSSCSASRATSSYTHWVSTDRRALKGKEDEYLPAIPLASISLSLKLSWMWL